MNNLNSELKDVLNTLESYGTNIKDNVNTLSENINNLENKIESDSKNSLFEIKSSLVTLKEKIESSTEKFTSINEFREIEHSKLLINYYSTIIFLKNDYMNNSLKITDRLNKAFIKYNDERNKFYLTINGIINDQITTTDSLIKKCVSFILKTLDQYKGILSKYSELFSRSFNEIIKEIKMIDSIFNNQLNELNKRIKDIKDKFSFKITDNNLFLVDYDDNAHDNTQSIEKISIDYSKKKDSLLLDFKNRTTKDLNRIELLLLNIFNETYSLDLKKKDILDIVKNNDDDILYQELIKIDNNFSINEFKDVVNKVYKAKNERDYNFYKEEFKNLESTYKKKIETIEYLNKEKDIIKNNLNSESNAFYNEYANEALLKDDYLEYKRFTKERIDCIFDYKIKSLSLFKLINEVTYNYEYEKSVIESSFMKEIRDSIISLDYEINSLKNESIVKNEERNSFILDMENSNKKTLYLLDYESEKINIEKNYQAKKAFLKLAFELFKQEKEISLLESRSELERIVSQYEAISATYSAIYESQKELIEKNKERVNMLDVSNYDYALSLLKHRTLVADQMLDLALKEYSLRIDILNQTRNMSKDYLEKLIMPIIDTYLDDCKELNRIKANKLEPIINKLSNRTPLDFTNKKAKEILNEYNSAIKELNELLLNDKSVKYSRLESKNIDEAVLNAIENAQIIRNQSMKKALNEIINANKEFESIVKSLDQKDIDFNVALEDYKLTYFTNKGRLDKKLEKDSEPILEEISEINKRYNNDDFIRRIDLIENEYENSIKRLSLEYSKKMSSITDVKEVDYEKLLVDKNNKSSLEYKTSIKNNKDTFYVEKNTAYNVYLSNIKKLKTDSNRKANAYKNEIESFKKMCLDMIDSIIKLNSSSINSLKKTTILKNLFNLEEFENIEKDYNNKIKKINKEINKKYKNISIYDLKKK